jgi:hypothetical protein
MPDDSHRSVRDGSCAEGISYQHASRLIPSEAYDATHLEFSDASGYEMRAAVNLLTYTGIRPLRRDRDGRQGAVDIELRGPDGSVEVAEVTSTRDEKIERDLQQSERLAAETQDRYTGQASWSMHFTAGWRAPSNQKKLISLAVFIAKELEALDVDGRDFMTIKSVPWLNVHRVAGVGVVEVNGWNANIPDSARMPYAERLSLYLHSSPLISRKRQKLAREANQLGAQRQHLYLFVTGAGTDGALLPASPAHMTWGDFACPPEITDLWVDGGGDKIFQWNLESGWSFHRRWSAWDSFS